MKTLVVLMYVWFAIFILISTTNFSDAAEHGGMEHMGGGATMKEQGKEHGGKEHGGGMMEEPKAEDIRQIMRAYVEKEVKNKGAFEIQDKETGKLRKLSLVKVHERVGKTGNYYYSCADFKDMDTGEMLDLDIDVENKNGKLKVVDVRIHKLNGKERYTYDKNDNRVPLKE